ncbi:hypothetical protein EK21DRAFT_116115 [Setomelanomma holmii]|uniref:Heterokaryon incompatibility domain-containing protein n=1 Tax=Setomelanomma holmii TaxID=210430 RepID=A0A9P4H1G2_9PLEO|nr:hypothetical protein EK21DRAFT_116115 [Setomelanomma holmii]
MRLLNSKTLEFKIFNDEKLPRYAILSHTWGDEEVNFQEMRLIQRLESLPAHMRENDAYLAALAAASGLDISMEWAYVTGRRAGYRKIAETALITEEEEISWLWVDTCCIYKSSSVELQEAINSMYPWYQNSAACIAFLDDAIINPSSTDQDFEDELRRSRWVTRGWTL